LIFSSNDELIIIDPLSKAGWSDHSSSNPNSVSYNGYFFELDLPQKSLMLMS